MPISKDRQTSRRKRATGFFKKASEIPEVELFIVMKYRGTQEIKTYDWTSGRILDELPKLIDQLRRDSSDGNILPSYWQRFDPSMYTVRLQRRSPNKVAQRGNDVLDVPQSPDHSVVRPSTAKMPLFPVEALPKNSKKQLFKRLVQD